MMRLIKSEFVYHYLNWYNKDVSIEEMEKDLEELKKLGATHIQFDADVKYGDLEFNIKPLRYREETDKEVQERIELIQKKGEAIKKQELQQLEI